jgi:hypothetical protein
MRWDATMACMLSRLSFGVRVARASQLRVLQYTHGDFFLPHRDHACEVGQSQLLPYCRSFFSLLVYLEDAHDGGGATRFYLPARSAVPGGDGDGDARGGMDGGGGASGSGETGMAPSDALAMRTHDRPTGNVVIADVVPCAGRAVVFPHRLLHESMPIPPGGLKLVVRGDLLYRQQVPSTTTAEVQHRQPHGVAPVHVQPAVAAPRAERMGFLAAAAARAADAVAAPAAAAQRAASDQPQQPKAEAAQAVRAGHRVGG